MQYEAPSTLLALYDKFGRDTRAFTSFAGSTRIAVIYPTRFMEEGLHGSTGWSSSNSLLSALLWFEAFALSARQHALDCSFSDGPQRLCATSLQEPPITAAEAGYLEVESLCCAQQL